MNREVAEGEQGQARDQQPEGLGEGGSDSSAHAQAHEQHQPGLAHTMADAPRPRGGDAAQGVEQKQRPHGPWAEVVGGQAEAKTQVVIEAHEASHDQERRDE